MTFYNGMEKCKKFVTFLKKHKLTNRSEFTVTDIDGAYRLQFEDEETKPNVPGGWPKKNEAFTVSFFFEIYDRKKTFYWDLVDNNYMNEEEFIEKIEILLDDWKRNPRLVYRQEQLELVK